MESFSVYRILYGRGYLIGGSYYTNAIVYQEWSFMVYWKAKLVDHSHHLLLYFLTIKYYVLRHNPLAPSYSYLTSNKQHFRYIYYSYLTSNEEHFRYIYYSYLTLNEQHFRYIYYSYLTSNEEHCSYNTYNKYIWNVAHLTLNSYNKYIWNDAHLTLNSYNKYIWNVAHLTMSIISDIFIIAI
jgi:hypothetical protein